MRKISKLLSIIILLGLVSCGNNVEKSRIYLDKGMDYLYSSQFDEAIEYFNTAIKHDKNNHEAYFYRGCAKYNNFLKQEAIEDYLKTTEINPDYAQAYFNIGLYYRSINDYDMACYYFKIADEKGKSNMEDYLRHCR